MTEFPAAEAALAMLTETKGESDRGNVLIHATFIDNQLRIIISNFLVEDTGIPKLLEGPNAPVGSFSSRIRMARSLGLITAQESSVSNAIRKIRNEFAHNIHVDINDDAIRAHAGPFVELYGLKQGTKYDLSMLFYMSAMMMTNNLLNRAEHVKTYRLRNRDWPIERPGSENLPEWEH